VPAGEDFESGRPPRVGDREQAGGGEGEAAGEGGELVGPLPPGESPWGLPRRSTQPLPFPPRSAAQAAISNGLPHLREEHGVVNGPSHGQIAVVGLASQGLGGGRDGEHRGGGAGWGLGGMDDRPEASVGLVLSHVVQPVCQSSWLSSRRDVERGMSGGRPWDRQERAGDARGGGRLDVEGYVII
jgi:hypothetical protein